METHTAEDVAARVLRDAHAAFTSFVKYFF
jgi:hypothetical protein